MDAALTLSRGCRIRDHPPILRRKSDLPQGRRASRAGSEISAQPAAAQFQGMAFVGIVRPGVTVARLKKLLPAGLVAQPLLEGFIDDGPVAGLLW